MKIFFAAAIAAMLLQTVLIGAQPVSLTPAQIAYLKGKKEITMCADPDWEPFEIIDGEGKHVGIAADLIALVSERLGVPIRLVPTATWQETLDKSKSGQCDILSFVNQTPEREKWLVFTRPLLSDPNILITREEHPFVGNLAALDGERMALPDGTAMLERFRKDFPNLEYLPVVSESDAVEMVSERRADLTVRSLIVAAYTTKKEGLFNLKIAGQPAGYENHLRMGVRKDEPILRDILDKGIATITPIEREAIINRHAGVIVKKGIDHETVVWIVAALFGTIALAMLWNTLLRRKVRSEVAKNLAIREQLYRSAKQAEIGNMIANISHQWREPLSKLSSINLLLLAKLRTGQEVEREWLHQQSRQIEETIDFMSQTMQNFLEFYKQNDRRSVFSIKESIEGVLSIIETRLLDHAVSVTLEGDERVSVEGVKNEWMQIWLNLLNNAVQVLAERGVEQPRIRIRIEEGSVSFCDNAGGMKPLNSVGGLGLPMCREIAAKYGAAVELDEGAEGLCAKVVLRSGCDTKTE